MVGHNREFSSLTPPKIGNSWNQYNCWYLSVTPSDVERFNNAVVPGIDLVEGSMVVLVKSDTKIMPDEAIMAPFFVRE